MGCTGSKDAAGSDVSVKNPAQGEVKRGVGDVNVAAALRAKRGGVHHRTEVDPNFRPKVIPKSDRAKEHIRSAIKDNILFNTLRDEEIEQLVDAMEPMQYAANTIVIQQGAKGDNFYVIERGTFDIIVGGKKVAEFGEGTAGMSFGELALLYNSPRAATVRSTSLAKLWAIGRATFRHIIANSNAAQMSKLKGTLRRVALLKDLEEDQLNRVAAAAQLVTFRPGDQIIRKGDIGDVFYIIEKGKVICKDLPGGQSNNVLHQGDYFGERALLKDEPRAANVYAESDCSLMALHREDFNALLGHLRDVLDYNLGMRVLLCVPLFRSLSSQEREALFEALRPVSFGASEYCITEGEYNSTFYIIKEGVAGVYKGESEVNRLSAGQWFGDAELMSSSGVAEQSVATLTELECFGLEKSVFEELLGPMEELLSRAAPPAEAQAMGGGGGGGGGGGSSVALIPEPRPMADIRFDELEMRATLGTGTFGRVRLAHQPSTGSVYALKILQKAQVVALRQETNIMNEKRLLASLDHPFVLRLHQTFKDKNCLYMLLDLVQGGELFSRLQNANGRVSVSDARFYAACVLDAFDYLHSKYILYRDLKPENLLIDDKGYIKVVDFGFAKVVPDRTYTLCGTPEYLAPELVLGKGHDKGVDYWALGVLIYEMVVGYSPFADHQNGDQMVICRNILRGDLAFPSWCNDAKVKESVKLLLEKEPTKRIGSLKGAAKDIKALRFFNGIEWDALRAKKLPAPWVPKVKDPLDTSNFDPYDEEDDVQPYRDDGSGWDAEF
jgi:cGMP-dependent protein kinase